jgi:WW domain-binding protein 2
MRNDGDAQGLGFVRLPNERPVNSASRVSLSLSTPRAYPAHDPLSIQSSSGTLYLTNQRVVYLPEKPTNEFNSFAASLLNLHDTHITVPWFGPNIWQALVQPVSGGNIPQSHHVELKLTFKDGGAPDFHSNFERIKERLQQAVDVARADNSGGRGQSGGLNGVNMSTVHLDQLPSYADSGRDRMAPATDESAPNLMDEPEQTPQRPQGDTQTSEQNPGPPRDAPPGYEETQQQSVQAELERRLLRES